jgi:hypothetical protein
LNAPVKSGSSVHGTLTQAPLEQTPVHVSERFHKPSVEQVSTVAEPSVAQRVAPGEHSRQLPATQTAVVPEQVVDFQAPLLHSRAVDEETQSCAPSMHTHAPPVQTGVSARQSACATQVPIAEQTRGVFASKQSTALAVQPHWPVAAMHCALVPLHAPCETHCPLLLHSCGVLPTQRAAAGVHSTQPPDRQLGVEPLQAAWSTHLPLASQACGVVALPHWTSPALQVPHIPVSATHAGVAPLHAVPSTQAVPPALHCCGRPALQRRELGSQSWHAPPTHAGLAPAHGV